MKYLAWVGQNAITGTPNRITGYYSKWGKLYAFSTRKERDDFCDTYDNIHNCYPRKTNRKDARQYFLGMSVRDYKDYVDCVLAGLQD